MRMRLSIRRWRLKSRINSWLALVAVAVVLAGCASEAVYQPPQPPRVEIVPTAQVEVAVVGSHYTPMPTPTGDGNPLTAQPLTLPVGMHISASGSYTETEDEAVGYMMCRIERNSCAFRQLAYNSDPEILWSNGEEPPYDDEDHLMHPEMALALDRLKALVREAWGGAYQIMVTEAYDSQLVHDPAQYDLSRKYSQHFEGRSIDMVLWPAAPEQLGRLCALAHHAGFDWVHNEQTHCHASVNAPSLCAVCSWQAGN